MTMPTAAPGKPTASSAPRPGIGLYAMAALYTLAGIAHFAATSRFEAIVPDYLPAHRALVLVSGLAEIAGGLGLLPATTRRAAACGLIALLVAVFPANLWMLQQHDRFPGVPVWALAARLPLQLVLIAWAWKYTRRRALSYVARASE
jgi:uncharacterized membrane protein